jgi:hypothetical protein
VGLNLTERNLEVSKAVASTTHQLIRFPTPDGLMEIRGDQATAKRCYAAAMKLGSSNPTSSSDLVLEEFGEEDQ